MNHRRELQEDVLGRGHQGASRAAPGKSGLHARGEGERVRKIEGRRRRGQRRMRWLDGITDTMEVGLSEFRELVVDRDPSRHMWLRDGVSDAHHSDT